MDPTIIKSDIITLAKDKAENQYWMPVIIGPSDSAALKTDMIL